MAAYKILGPMNDEYRNILTPEAIEFLVDLHRKFESTRQVLLNARVQRQTELDQGKLPTFLAETEWIRKSDYKAASIPQDIQDRRIEITGPVDRKMIINALNSGANVFMADLEDSSSPTWNVVISGQINLKDAVNRTITFEAKGKSYALRPENELAVLMVRPRGWHLNEAHFVVDNVPMSGSLFDFALYFFHNAKTLVSKGTAPYFYLPKMESHLEARLWNDVFVYSQAKLGIPHGTIRATVLIETILAAFEMDEIIYELRHHSAGLNCGRWDYIFSFIKKFQNRAEFLIPDRAQVTMTTPWLAAYVKLLIKTCHRRGTFAMGGMAAQIPINDNPELNKQAMDKVTADKLREVRLGHDGTWVAHPALIPVALAAFNQYLTTPNQIHYIPEYDVNAEDLLDVSVKGTMTKQGLVNNIDVGLHYFESWLRGVGCVPIHHLMEDAATAEISRVQMWQWIRHNAVLTNGEKVTKELVQREFDSYLSQLKQQMGEKEWNESKFPLAAKLYSELTLSDKLGDFLTSAAYPYICTFTEDSCSGNCSPKSKL